MIDYICSRCGKEFKKKYNYDRHVMGRKNGLYPGSFSTTLWSQTPQKRSQKTPKSGNGPT